MSACTRISSSALIGPTGTDESTGQYIDDNGNWIDTHKGPMMVGLR
jgi:hypothetical protein